MHLAGCLVCFSATADSVAAGVIGSVGIATLTQVRTRRDVPFASLPLLFAAHQFTEGFVWLSLEGHISAAPVTWPPTCTCCSPSGCYRSWCRRRSC